MLNENKIENWLTQAFVRRKLEKVCTGGVTLCVVPAFLARSFPIRDYLVDYLVYWFASATCAGLPLFVGQTGPTECPSKSTLNKACSLTDQLYGACMRELFLCLLEIPAIESV
jgi:hypothetical protein